MLQQNPCGGIEHNDPKTKVPNPTASQNHKPTRHLNSGWLYTKWEVARGGHHASINSRGHQLAPHGGRIRRKSQLLSGPVPPQPYNGLDSVDGKEVPSHHHLRLRPLVSFHAYSHERSFNFCFSHMSCYLPFSRALFGIFPQEWS